MARRAIMFTDGELDVLGLALTIYKSLHKPLHQSDDECPKCSRAEETLDKVATEYAIRSLFEKDFVVPEGAEEIYQMLNFENIIESLKGPQ